MDLSENQFFGSIPSSYGDMAKLQYLSLANNLFDSGIPSELGRLELLETLILGKSTQHFHHHVHSPLCS
jgi:hypothetical protein